MSKLFESTPLVVGEEPALDPVNDHVAKGTIWGTTFNTITCVMGGGVLTLSAAFMNSSIGVGVIMSCIFPFVAAFTGYVLVRGCDASNKYTMNQLVAHALFPSPSLDEFLRVNPTCNEDDYRYGEQKRYRLRVFANAFVEFVVFALSFGCLCVYGIVISTSIPPVIKGFLHGSGIVVENNFWLGLAGGVFFLLTCVRTMNELKWTSILGFLTIFYVAVLVVIKHFTGVDESRFKPAQLKEVETVREFVVDMGLFRTVGNLCLAYAYHFNAPIFYRELGDRSPKKYMKTLAIAYPVITGSYIMTAVSGYLTFGALVKTHGGNIIDQYSEHDIAANIGRLGLFAHFCCVYPLLSVVSRQVFHRTITSLKDIFCYTGDEEDEIVRGNRIHDPSFVYDTPRWIIILEAFLIVGCSILLAAFVPGINPVVEVAGVLGGVFIMLFFPAIIGIRLWGPWGARVPTVAVESPGSTGPYTKVPTVLSTPASPSKRNLVSSFECPERNNFLFGFCCFLVVFSLFLQFAGMYSIYD